MVVDALHKDDDFVVVFGVVVQLHDVVVVEDALDGTLLSGVVQLIVAEQFAFVD